MIRELLALLRELRGLPDWMAWRLDTFVVRVEDSRLLSPPVQWAIADYLKHSAAPAIVLRHS